MQALAAFRKDFSDIEYHRIALQGSFMLFIQTFYPILNGYRAVTIIDSHGNEKEELIGFKLANSISRESYQITIAKALRQSFDNELKDANGNHLTNLMINIPPRYGKTTMMHYFAAWCFARYPDSNFLYISYEQTLAALQTLRIREIISHPEYQRLFDLRLSSVSKAKDYFETTQGGSMFAAGSGGPITGRGCGIRNVERFGGAMIIDDIHKPVDVTSDTKREAVVDWLYNTAQSRLNNPKRTPMWVIGQKLHEADAYEHLRKRGDFKCVIIPALDAAGNALDPDIHTKEQLKEMQRLEPYNFAAQYMQNPQPSGGGIFKPEWFHLVDHEPEILRTFITCDSAETDKDYNDATVFSLWGLYKLKYGTIDTGIWGLHWMDCREMRIEPKDLEPQFYAFYMNAMRGKVRPDVACIEKKSSGTTLVSLLKQAQGLRVLEVERYRQNGRAYSKVDRFLECQSYVAAKRISFTRNSLHIESCIEQCRKITANNTHAHDDIADTMQMAIQCALIEGIILPYDTHKEDEVMNELASQMRNISSLRAHR